MNSVAHRESFAGGHLVLEKRGWLATILFDRAAKRNAFSQAMWQAMPEIVARVEADDTVRVVLVRGAGGTLVSAGIPNSTSSVRLPGKRVRASSRLSGEWTVSMSARRISRA